MIFDQISDRRKLRRRIAIASVSAVIFIVIAAFSVIRKEDETVAGNGQSVSKPTSCNEDKISDSDKVVGEKKFPHDDKFVKGRCHDSLHMGPTNATSPSSTRSKDRLRAAIAAAVAEIEKAADKTKTLNPQNDTDNAAFHDCTTLLSDAATELKNSLQSIGNSTDPNMSTDSLTDIAVWLSAVMSHQRTCVDGFNDVVLKVKMRSALSVAKRLTSKSLAAVSEFGSVGSARVGGRERVGVPLWVGESRWNEKQGLKRANAVVAKDGSGNFWSIREAVEKIPMQYQGRYVIHIKKRVYHEHVTLLARMANVTMYGDGSEKTIITGHKNFADGTQTFQTATFAVMGHGFTAVAIGFRNTAGPRKLQAVAARVQSDRAVFLGCRFEGFQDTLYVQTHRQFYRSCLISGTVDFIFGDAAAVFQNCKIVIRRPAPGQTNTVTAHGRTDKHETTGIVLHGCHVTADESLEKGKFKSYLGRPWQDYARAIVMETKIDDFIEPEGWLNWEGRGNRSDKVYFGEYLNKGGGSKMDKRVTWRGFHKLGKNEAVKFTVGKFLHVDWVTARGAPVNPGLFN